MACNRHDGRLDEHGRRLAQEAKLFFDSCDRRRRQPGSLIGCRRWFPGSVGPMMIRYFSVSHAQHGVSTVLSTKRKLSSTFGDHMPFHWTRWPRYHLVGMPPNARSEKSLRILSPQPRRNSSTTTRTMKAPAVDNMHTHTEVKENPPMLLQRNTSIPLSMS